jgi:hypothetical protein
MRCRFGPFSLMEVRRVSLYLKIQLQEQNSLHHRSGAGPCTFRVRCSVKHLAMVILRDTNPVWRHLCYLVLLFTRDERRVHPVSTRAASPKEDRRQQPSFQVREPFREQALGPAYDIPSDNAIQNHHPRSIHPVHQPLHRACLWYLCEQSHTRLRIIRSI